MDHALDVPDLAAGGGFTLRPWRLTDLPLVREASEDAYIPLITTVPAPYSEAEGVAFVERQWGRASTGTGYPFVIVDPGGRPVGNAGLWLRPEPDRASVGYWVVESARGRGAALAALRSVADWARRDLALTRLELHVEPWNTASVRTAERAGFRRERLVRDGVRTAAGYRDVFLYARSDDGTRGTPGTDP
ncbi:GNAT family N-acetyltransferase [Streptomyces sp. SS]|uniref:GNAT family N-acetyltransferase n=1 Tax=Streptomyces sp. SS TaxID=260742 RepID=UPI000323277D|nr:GNAT family protein [Streptomyces sp. SS]